MNPAAFIEKWSRSELRERQGSQSHFNDLCALLGEPTPAEADPAGISYCFERGAAKVGGGDGWADVWRRGCFGWEYKGKHKDLNAALRQLQIYAPDLENPPYLVVSDMERIVVHTNWTNTVRRTLTFGFDDLREPAKLDLLRQVFRGSDSLKPGLSPQELTEKVALRFGDLGRRLQERGHEPQAVAHFLNRLIFCMFAEDCEILPKGLFTRTVQATQAQPAHAKAQLDELFAKMRIGGFFGADAVRFFNGGLFDGAGALPLERDDLHLIATTAAEHDWSNIDPAVFGTMFEAALKTTGRRAALGAHYTDRDKIRKIVDPVIVRPLTAEWDAALSAMRIETDAMAAAEAERKAVQEEAAAAMSQGAAAYRAGEADRRKALTVIARRRSQALGRATAIRDAFLDRLAAFRVLDPACGSGNFLYVALQALRDIELRALLDADRLGVPQASPRVGLDAVLGLEIEAYAAELARVTLWIGNLQWERRNGYTAYAEPILHALETIENRDALLNPDGSEAAWPAADVIIGNPPFLGGGDLLGELGETVTIRLRKAYINRVPGRADLVAYWIKKSSEEVLSGKSKFFGLVATKSVAKGVSRLPIDYFLKNNGRIFEAWTNEAWALKGAAVRVCIICATKLDQKFADLYPVRLNGIVVSNINPDLTDGTDVTGASALHENQGIAFQGIKLTGPFDINGNQAREMLKEPKNINGRHNSDVIRRLFDIDDVVGRDSDRWVIDLNYIEEETEIAKFEAPMKIISQNVYDFRKKISISREYDSKLLQKYWKFERSRPKLRAKVENLNKYIITPESSEYRLFIFAPKSVLIQGSLFAIAREDFTTFGILSSRIHEIWSTAQGNRLGVGNQRRYNKNFTFETFPFPEGLTLNIDPKFYEKDERSINIETAARELNEMRETWINPPELIKIEPEVYPEADMIKFGHQKIYPDRILPKDAAAATVLKTRTLTNLYNARPTWLDNAHKALDAAVAAAYGWPADLTDDEILSRLFALNQERAQAGR